MSEHNYEYRKATMKDIDLLLKARLAALRALNRIDDGDDLSCESDKARGYYEEALKNNTHTAYLVLENEEVIACGGICYYSVMPSYSNPSGRKAYIMNMYTDPRRRRKGIAAKILELLVKDAKNKGVYMITLEATEMARPLYEKYGFTAMKSEMELRSELISEPDET